VEAVFFQLQKISAMVKYRPMITKTKYQIKADEYQIQADDNGQLMS
jgi:hypothetical protein